MDYYLATKNNKIMSFAATWMQLEIIIPSEFRKRKTDPYLYVETVQMNLYKQKQTHRHGDQTCGCQVGGRGGASWEFAGRCLINICGVEFPNPEFITTSFSRAD